MSYIVLARKWRPQVFEDVVGQQHITKTLQNAISQNRVSHAFLFTGARGVGKTSTARILAKALNCERGPQINPCNKCVTCEEITHGTSLDVIEIDGASNRGIDEVRELRENVRYIPSKSRYKIYIIDEVHMLTREAFNALLKTLEEPPPHIIFIFATTEPHKIPETILSRCQRYDFKRIPLRLIVESLKRIVNEEQVKISERGIFLIAQESQGSLRDAQSLLDQIISYGGKDIKDEDIVDVLGIIDRQIIYDTIDSFIARDVEGCLKIVNHIYQYGVDLQYFCKELLQYLRNLILIKVSRKPEDLLELTEDEFKILKRQAESFQFEHLNHLFSILIKGEEEITQSAFPRVMLEMTLLRMVMTKPIIPIDEILEKLESLEKKGELVESSETLSTSIDLSFKDSESLSKVEKPFEAISDDGTGKLSEELVNEEIQRHSTKEKNNHSLNNTEISLHTYEDTPESQEYYREIWKDLVEFTKIKNPILGSFLALGSLVKIKDEKIILGFEKDSFHYDRIMEKENKTQLESICREFFKKDIKLVISPIELKEKQNNHLNGKEKRINNFGIDKEKKEEILEEVIRLFNGKIIKNRIGEDYGKRSWQHIKAGSTNSFQDNSAPRRDGPKDY